MGYWKIDTNEQKDILNIELVGELPPERAQEFAIDFLEAQKGLDPKNCKVVFDVSRWYIYPCDVKSILHDFFVMYREKGYKVVLMKIYLPQKELRRQMVQLAEKVKLETLEFFII